MAHMHWSQPQRGWGSENEAAPWHTCTSLSPSGGGGLRTRLYHGTHALVSAPAGRGVENEAVPWHTCTSLSPSGGGGLRTRLYHGTHALVSVPAGAGV